MMISKPWCELIKFAEIGLVAACTHYAVLFYLIEYLNVKSASIATIIAACFGISVSFVGNRFFVFSRHTSSTQRQAARFFLIYSLTGTVHGLTLLAWTDWMRLPYQYGFLMATIFQASFNYCLCKTLVFKK